MTMLFSESLYVNGCQIIDKEMNCNGLKLQDCPIVNTNITILKLDSNSLHSLSTETCVKWFHLVSLSVQRNNLSELLNWKQFTNLETLILTDNSLTKFEIFSKSLQIVDVSHNLIKTVDESHVYLPGYRSVA